MNSIPFKIQGYSEVHKPPIHRAVSFLYSNPIMTLKVCNSLSEIASSYEYFLIDLWGVVHDGYTPFPGVIESLEALRHHKKKILFITNSPRPGNVLTSMLDSMEIHKELYDFIYSSGDAVIDGLNTGDNPLKEKPYYFLGDDPLHASLIDELPAERTFDLEKAHYVLLSSLTPTTSFVLEEALKMDIPLLCANPDMVVIHKKIPLPCPGSAAKQYEDLGGTVFYYGKPYPPIYEASLKRLGNPPMDKVLAIGDGLGTDIQGANTMGIDSVLIQGGIHHSLSLDALEKKCQKETRHPTYVMSQFIWS